MSKIINFEDLKKSKQEEKIISFWRELAKEDCNVVLIGEMLSEMGADGLFNIKVDFLKDGEATKVLRPKNYKGILFKKEIAKVLQKNKLI